MGSRKANVMIVGKYQNDSSATGAIYAKTFRKTAKNQEMNIMTTHNKRGHCLSLGKPGSGMSVSGERMSQFASQIKAQYSDEDRERLAEAIRQNCNIWYPLKPGDGHHDK